MKKYVGDIFESNNFGKYKILEEVFDNTDRKGRSFKIQFLDTGYTTVVTLNAIRRGSIKDKLVPNVANIGFVGYLDKPVTSEDVVYFYRSWNDMINRCYNKNNSDYYLYGGMAVRVDERWFNFSNFFEDAKLLPGYEYKIKYPTMYQLDKDYLQLSIPKSERIYSINTCLWISKYDNIMIMNREHHGSSGYYGVFFKDGVYCTRINNVIYGRFTNAEAAANLFNYLYPLYKNEFNNIQILNNVTPIPFNELEKYAVNKNIYLGSTTISEGEYNLSKLEAIERLY